MKDYELTGKDCLELLLVEDLSLQTLADRQRTSITIMFKKICQYVETLEEEEQIEILDAMYFSKKFSIFFTVAKEVILGKTLEQIKKKHGVTKSYTNNFDLLSKSSLLKDDIDKYLKSWQETVIVNITQKKRRSNGTQTIRNTY